jgi:hypothetical protein
MSWLFKEYFGPNFDSQIDHIVKTVCPVLFLKRPSEIRYGQKPIIVSGTKLYTPSKKNFIAQRN